MQDVRALNELVAKESAFVDDLIGRGRQGHRRSDLHDRAHPDRPADRRPRAARGRARAWPRRSPCARSATPFTPSSRASSSRPICCRPTSSAPSSTTSRPGEFTSKLGPIFANLVLADEINRAPAKVQSALLEAMQERQVTIGDKTLPAARAVHRHGHAEPDRAGGHLPAARSAGRSLHADGQGRLPDARGGAADHGSHDRAWSAPAQRPKTSRPSSCSRRARSCATSTSTTASRTTSSTSSSRRASPQKQGLKDLAPLIEYGASPRASIALNLAARAHAFLRHRGYVTPEDVKAIGPDVLRHRVVLTLRGRGRRGHRRGHRAARVRGRRSSLRRSVCSSCLNVLR